jgi:protein-arginine kinase activator protein McsA
MANIICDKCGSGDVKEYYKPKKKEPQAVYKMSEVVEGKRPGPSNIQHAVMTYSTMVLECQNCGYTLEYTRSDQLGSVITPLKSTGIAKAIAQQPLQVNKKSHHYE